MTRVPLEARVEHRGDAPVALQELDHLLGVVAVPVHPDAEGLDAAQHQPGVERPGDGADGVLVEGDLVGKLGIAGRSGRRRPRRSGRPGTWWWSAPPRRRRAPAAAAGRARRRCCRPPAGRPASWASWATIAMSATFSSGLVGVSSQTTLVCPGRIAARIASGWVTAAGVMSDPPAGRAPSRTAGTCRRTRRRGTTTWSPGSHSDRISVSSAARPLAKAKPRSPASIAARHSSSAVRVGLPSGSTRSRCAGRPHRPACRCWSRRSAVPPRRWWGRARSRRGWLASRSRTAEKKSPCSLRLRPVEPGERPIAGSDRVHLPGRARALVELTPTHQSYPRGRFLQLSLHNALGPIDRVQRHLPSAAHHPSNSWG